MSRQLAQGARQRPTDERVQRRRVAVSGLMGTTIEYYYFLIYGLIAPAIFSTLFFPNSSALVATIAALGTFAVGYASRPLGGIVFGHYGDRIGRKKMLYLTLLLMGGSTTLIGLLPTYAAIGVAASTLLVALRFLQGFALGGETAGAVILATDTSARTRFSGLGFSRALGGVVGGLFPLIAVSLYAGTSTAWSVIGYYVGISAVSFVAVCIARETHIEPVG